MVLVGEHRGRARASSSTRAARRGAGERATILHGATATVTSVSWAARRAARGTPARLRELFVVSMLRD